MDEGERGRLREVVEASERLTFRGSVHRAHSTRYASTDPGGALRVTGRWNYGLDRFPSDRAFPALYTALEEATTLAEVIRHIRAGRIKRLKDYGLSRIAVALSAVLDARDPSVFGLVPNAFTRSRVYTASHSVADEAIKASFEAVLAPSASLAGDNLIIFTDRLHSDSGLTHISTQRLQLRP